MTLDVATVQRCNDGELTEEQQHDEKRRLRERVGLRKTLQFGPDVLENRHHFL